MAYHKFVAVCIASFSLSGCASYEQISAACSGEQQCINARIAEQEVEQDQARLAIAALASGYAQGLQRQQVDAPRPFHQTCYRSFNSVNCYGTQ